MAAGKPCCASLSAMPSGSLDHSAPTVLLLSMDSHRLVNTAVIASTPQKKWLVHSKPFFGSPLRPKNQACQGVSVVMHGTPFSSHWSATGMVVSDVDEPSTRSTLSELISSEVTCAARFGFDWLSFL